MKNQVKLNIQENIQLAPYTTFKIGGPAKYFAEVASEEELVEALNFAKENNLDFFVLGGGSNILVSDKGFDGLVIKVKSQNSNLKIASKNSKVSSVDIWAGDNLSKIVRIATENSLTGLEWAVGIPGTVGGAIYGNAGAYGADMSKIVESVKVLEIENDKSREIQSSKFKTYAIDKCKFGYRNSVFKQNKNLIILSCVLGLKNGDEEEIKNRTWEIIKKRTEKIPKEFSAGSFFENPVVKDENLIARFEKDTGMKCKDDKLPAGWLIDEIGFRGKKVGSVMISEKHSNFIVNLGDGTAEDVIILVGLIKQKIREKFSIQLKEEVIFVGF